MPVALVTGGSAGLGRALVHALSTAGWTVVTDGRRAEVLAASVAGLPAVVAVAGDVADPEHRAALVREVEWLGRLDLLIHNASTLGPVPLPRLADVDPDEVLEAWRTNATAALALTQLALPLLHRSAGTLVSISSDAAVEHYETWGAYGAGKAALDHVTLTLGAEEGLRTYAIDPGDMRTAMNQAAFPDEDISDRPEPSTVAPHVLALLRAAPPTGRYRAVEFALQGV